MPEQYRFIQTEPLDAALNMAIDESMHLHHLEGAVPPTLRVFRWERPSISLGRFQSIEREIDTERCQSVRQSSNLVRTAESASLPAQPPVSRASGQ